MSSDADVRADVEKMCAALLQLLPLQDEREAISIQGITYMSACSGAHSSAAFHLESRPPQPHHQYTASQG